MNINKRTSFICFIFICIVYIIEMQISSLQSVFARNKQLFAHNLHVNSFDGKAADENLMLHSTKALSSYHPVVIYNRIPKTGSTSFVHNVYAMTKKNKIYVCHVNTTRNALKLSLGDQYALTQNISLWRDVQPAFYHGHFAHITFSKFGFQDPVYINLLREPLERLVSHYYFLRYGDDLRKGLKRIKQGDKTSFDECVAKGGRDCQSQKMWVQIPMLCGQSAGCWKVGNQWALDEAKRNLVLKYMLVGVTELMEDFIAVLEATMPVMFDGLSENFRQGSNSYVRKTLHKQTPSNVTVATVKETKIYRMERELYDFAVKHFKYIQQLSMNVDRQGHLRPVEKQFKYEKLYGPKGVILT